jgi:hypothetical protein
MARRSAGGMSLPEPIRQEALRPVASPVDTFVRPNTDAVDEATAKAQYLENTLSTVEKPLKAAYQETMDQRQKEAKLQATLDAYGEYYKWYGETAPSLEGLDPAKVQDVWSAKFNERFGNETDTLKSYALKELLANSIASEVKQQANRRSAEIQEDRYSKWTIGLSGQLAEAAKRGADDKERDAIIQGHFEAGRTAGLSGKELNKRMLRLQEDALAGGDRTKWDLSIYNHLVTRNQDKTGDADTNIFFDRIRGKLSTATTEEKELYQLDLRKRWGDLLQQNPNISEKTFRQYVDAEVKAGGLKMGLTDTFVESYIGQIRERQLKAQSQAARNAAISNAFTTAGGGLPQEDVTYVDAKGETKTVSQSELKRVYRDTGERVFGGKDSPAYMREVASRVQDPYFSAVLAEGIRAMDAIAVGADYKTEGARIVKAFEVMDKLYAAGGHEAVKTQLAGTPGALEKYQLYSNLKNQGYADDQITKMLSKPRAANINVDQKVLDAAVTKIMSTSSMWTFGDRDATNAGYIRKALKDAAEAHANATGNLDWNTIIEMQTANFMRNHFKSKDGAAFVFVTPEIQRDYGGQGFVDKVEVVLKDEEFRKRYTDVRAAAGVDAKKTELHLVPHPIVPNKFVIGDQSLGPLSATYTVTADDLMREYTRIKYRNQAAKKAKKETPPEQVIAP